MHGAGPASRRIDPMAGISDVENCMKGPFWLGQSHETTAGLTNGYWCPGAAHGKVGETAVQHLEMRVLRHVLACALDRDDVLRAGGEGDVAVHFGSQHDVIARAAD